MSIERPQAPGYLANLMARLFHEVSGQGLAPLGIEPAQFPILIELWFGAGATPQSLARTQESSDMAIRTLLASMEAGGLIAPFASDLTEPLRLTEKAIALRDPAIAAARRANQSALSALTESEAEQLSVLMNKVIDALQAAKG